MGLLLGILAGTLLFTGVCAGVAFGAWQLSVAVDSPAVGVLAMLAGWALVFGLAVLLAKRAG